MTKLLILDKDGTLVAPASGGQFVQHPKDQKEIRGVSLAIARTIASGWTLAIASNQDSVAAGHKSLPDAFDEMEFCMDLTGIELAMIAPSYEDEGFGEAWFLNKIRGELYKDRITNTQWRYRKPGWGMLKFLMHWVEADPTETLMVGDRTEDEQAAIGAGCAFAWASQWRVEKLYDFGE